MTIRILPANLVNRIAAGEVIERPASAMKELVENALDAGGTRIDVTIEQGGRNLIVVADNGFGMSKDELALCVERHATSKLTDENILDIQHFGFRGEALPSIGAVSRLTITSKAADSQDAWQIALEGGEHKGVSPAALKSGTRVEVRDLFFATPARLKFLKAERTEKQHIRSTLEQLAMAHPHIAFTLLDDGKKMLTLQPYSKGDGMDGHLQRIGDILGKEFMDNAVPIAAVRDAMTLTGYAGVPTYNRGTAAAQFLFVNGRPVRDKLVVGAVRGAYQDFLARDRHPVVVLFLELPFQEVDVNVHPAKSEVRFRDSGQVRGMIVSALRQALHAAGHHASTGVASAALQAFRPMSSSFPQYNNSSFSGPAPAPYPYASEPAGTGYLPQQSLMTMAAPPQAKLGESAPFAQEELSAYPLGAARAQLHETYILAQTADGIVLVDQHAAHERLVYEQMKTQMAARGIARQALLIPEVIELPEDKVHALCEQKAELATLGIIFEKFSDKAILVKEVPALFGKVNVQGLLRDLADDIAEYGEAMGHKERLEHICGDIACRYSVRSGRRLSADEMNTLLRQMEATPHSGQCNHGRPTYIKLKLSDIETLFGRR